MEGRTASSLVGGILDNNIRFTILEITEGKEYNISLVDPDLLRSHSAADDPRFGW